MPDIAYTLRRFGAYLIDPDRDQIAIGNIVFIAFCVATGALTGSLTSIYVVGGILYSIVQIWRGVVPWQFDTAALATAMAFAAFFVAELIAYLLHPGGDGVQEIISNLPFLGFFPIYSLLIVDRVRLVSVIERCAGLVAIIAAIAAMLSVSTPEARVELAAGNPGITAVLASSLFLINMIALVRNSQFRWGYSSAGCVGSIIVLLLTGMRALWPCLVIIPLIVAISFRFNVFRRFSAKFLTALLLAFMVISVVSSHTISQRIIAAEGDLSEISKNDFSSSMGTRLLLWKAGVKLIAEQPLLGYGPGNVVNKIEEVSANSGIAPVSFSHFHNAYINELIRAGVLGGMAMILMFLVPLYFVIQAPSGELRPWSVAMMAGLQSIYFLSGLTGIMIGHDILDTLLIVVTALCLYLARVVPDLTADVSHKDSL